MTGRRLTSLYDRAVRALEGLAGECGSISLTCHFHRSRGRGDRYESVTWGGAIAIPVEGGEDLQVSVQGCCTAADVVRRIRAELERELLIRTRSRLLERSAAAVPVVIEW